MLSNGRQFTARSAWRLVLAGLLCLAVTWPALAQQRVVRSSPPALQGNSTVRVMTRNMDSGTDLGYVLSGQYDFATGVFLTMMEVNASDPPARAARLAGEIAATKPDLVGLQEATIWQFPGVRYDQLQLLEDALEAAGQHYRVAAVQTLTDIPIDDGDFHAQYTDRNAILVRTDLPPGQLDVLGTATHTYAASLEIPLPTGSVTEYEGWMTADVRIRGARFEFVNTHLRSPVPSHFDETAYLQWLQAKELVAVLANSSLPIILVGDFNSDASTNGTGPDQTMSAGWILSAGYSEAWKVLKPADEGYTWGLFIEDQAPPDLFGPYTPNERIDLIFSRGPVPTAIAQTGTAPNEQGVLASDHIGVVADFALDNHRPDVPMRAVPRK